MTDAIMMKEENKLSKLLKDERGLTLVELLATVVILAIIAAIGVTAIGKVIQNAREDAGISNIQQAMNGAKLYYSTEAEATQGAGGTGKFTFTLEKVSEDGYIDIAKDTWDSTANVVFTVEDDGGLTMTVPKDSLKAGSKKSMALTNVTNDDILGLTREELWAKGISKP
ncbi:prepilin-type N-terminal cleavage/methylation domain-containing protein [Enterococcus faecalis]|uniref:type IV pilin protein n=1 Tax=Enterococcus faecalis TaxID=1351 RepID=UPI0019DC27DC|nr:prepilin-type N-terminal cleavage/methylation domain-containing protein [Enterococcus faecalis]EGO6705177.1 prepilin-type N-terminal cleavage/methylation domain-containing protein [Enterococcus faecalis]